MSLFLLPILLAAALFTLFVAALKLRGLFYAMVHTFYALVLSLFFGFGLVVIPKLVHLDVVTTFKTDQDDGAD